MKPLAKGVILKSASENPRWFMVFSLGGLFSKWSNVLSKITKTRDQKPKTKPAALTFNFRPLTFWHKISVAFASIAIIGVVVFFQFAPEKARVEYINHLYYN